MIGLLITLILVVLVVVLLKYLFDVIGLDQRLSTVILVCVVLLLLLGYVGGYGPGTLRLR